MDLCRQSRRSLNEHYLEQCSVRLHLAHSDRLSPADLLHGGMLQYSTKSLFLYNRGTTAKKDQVVFCCTCSGRWELCVYTPCAVSSAGVRFWPLFLVHGWVQRSQICRWVISAVKLILYSSLKNSNHVPYKDLLSSVQQSCRGTPYLMENCFCIIQSKAWFVSLVICITSESSLYIVLKQYNYYGVLCRTATNSILEFQVNHFILGLLLE